MHAPVHALSDTHTHTHTHTHMHTLCRLIGVKDNSEKRNVLSLLLKEERVTRVPDVLGEIVPDVGAKV